MGRVGTVIQFFRTSAAGKFFAAVKTHTGGGYNLTPKIFSAGGDDAPPLPGDSDYLAPTGRPGQFAALGFIDTKNAGVALAGEKRIYGRDAAGAIVNQFYLKRDGTIYASNAGGSMNISPNGAIVLTNISGGAIHILPSGDVMINGILFPLAGGIIPDAVGIDMATNGGDIDYGDFTTRTHIHILDIPDNKTLTPSI